MDRRTVVVGTALCACCGKLLPLEEYWAHRAVWIRERRQWANSPEAGVLFLEVFSRGYDGKVFR